MEINQYIVKSNVKWGLIKNPKPLKNQTDSQTSQKNIPINNPSKTQTTNTTNSPKNKFSQLNRNGYYLNSSDSNQKQTQINDDKYLLRNYPKYKKKRVLSCDGNPNQIKKFPTFNPQHQHSIYKLRKNSQNYKNSFQKMHTLQKLLTHPNKRSYLSQLNFKYGIQNQNQDQLDNQDTLGKLITKMKQSQQLKNQQIQVLSIYKNQIQLIQCMRQCNMTKAKISLQTLKSKTQIQNTLQTQQQSLKNLIAQLSQQSNLYNQYLLFITEKTQQPHQITINNDNCIIDLKEEQNIINNNIIHETQYLIKELENTKYTNKREIARIQKEILELRRNIKDREDKLKGINNRIFYLYTRKNKRREIKQRVERIMVYSHRIQEMDKIQIKNQIEKDNSIEMRNKLVKINFYYENQALNLHCQFEMSKKQIYTRNWQLRTILPQQQKNPINIQFTSKLKSLIFFFDPQSHIFKGIQAKYCNSTHSYDIGRESQNIHIGLCQQSDDKYQLCCRDKDFLKVQPLKQNDQEIIGFTFYYHKKFQQDAKIANNKSIKLERSQSTSSHGKLSIQSANRNKLDEIPLKKNTTHTKYTRKTHKIQNHKKAQAYTEYCLYK